MIDVAAARDLFEASTDVTVGIEEEFALLDQTLRLTPAFERLRDAGLEDPILQDAIAGELISSEIEIRSGRGEDFEDARRRQHEARRRLFALAAQHGRRARRHRHPPAVGLPEQHIIDTPALPPGRGRPEVRGVAQQHLQPARARRRPGRRPRRPGLRPPAPGAPAAAGDQRQLALRRPHRLRPALRPHADLHQVVPALRRPRRVRHLAGVGRLRRAAGAHQLDRRVHAAVVVGAPAPQLRHRRGARLRRPDHRPRGRRARPADRRLRDRAAARDRRGGGPARPARPPDRGEHVARAALRPRRPPARPRGAGDRGVPRRRGARPPARRGPGSTRRCPSSTAPSASAA